MCGRHSFARMECYGMIIEDKVSEAASSTPKGIMIKKSRIGFHEKA
jgi:hypothetical protein